jgi:hypothetical protein
MAMSFLSFTLSYPGQDSAPNTKAKATWHRAYISIEREFRGCALALGRKLLIKSRWFWLEAVGRGISTWHVRALLGCPGAMAPVTLSELLLLSTPIYWSSQSVKLYLLDTHSMPRYWVSSSYLHRQTPVCTDLVEQTDRQKLTISVAGMIIREAKEAFLK